MDDLLMVYGLTHLFLFGYALYMLIKFTPDIARKNEYVFFRSLIIEYLFFLVIALIWSYAGYGVIEIPHSAFWALSIIDMCNLATIGYILYIFIMIRAAPELSDNKLVQYGSPIFYLIEVFGIITSVWTHWMISVTADNQIIYEKGFLVFIFCSDVYFLILIVICLRRLRQAKTDARKRTIKTMLVAILLIIACAVGDNAFEKISILPIAVFGVIYFIFINMQESSINSDQLTGMNNRRKAMEYLSDRLSLASEERPLYLYMIDINSFKGINDTYGHSEGDQALILLAKSIKIIAGKYNAFAARLGGDEFLFAFSPKLQMKAEDQKHPITEISDLVRRECEEGNKPYTLTISSGLAVCEDPSVSLAHVMKEADTGLYEDKERYYQDKK